LSECFGGSVSCTCCKSLIAYRAKAIGIIMQRALLAQLCLVVCLLTARTSDVLQIKAAQHH